ncbi:hypothetical protein BBJ28_00004690 [Nothophytophthora sp. Chile5]|nr:hypothetical protein BBJ28_00004690 [Nothophytophthora sp. Chile5]
MHDAQVLALVPLSLVLGVPVGLLKERMRKHSLQRWLLALAPLALAPLVTSPLPPLSPFSEAFALPRDCNRSVCEPNALCPLQLSVRDGAVLAASFLVGRVLGASLVGVGLTGGIATGKSTVSKAFRDAGAVIVDADVVAREVVLPGHGAYKEIVRYFGPDVLNEDDATINRAKLGAIIFSDPAQRKKLNAATHKYIIWEMFKQLVYQRLICRKRLVVFDAPLLFETKLLEHFCYPIIVVACSETNELDRLMKRDDMAQEDAEKRIKAQMKLHQEKVEKADLVIQNDGALDELLRSTREVLQRSALLVGGSRELEPAPMQ